MELHGLDSEILADLESSHPCLITPRPAVHIQQISAALPASTIAIGPTVPIAEVSQSMACARRALSHIQRGLLPSRSVLWCDEYLTTLLLLSDERLLADLTDKALAPFDQLTPKQRARLESTLLTWLSTYASVNDTAEQLGLHPQTIRYRMHRINELIGPQLTEPGQRLTIEIGLQARQWLGDTRTAKKSQRRRTKHAANGRATSKSG